MLIEMMNPRDANAANNESVEEPKRNANDVIRYLSPSEHSAELSL